MILRECTRCGMPDFTVGADDICETCREREYIEGPDFDPDPCPICRGTGRVHELSPGDYATIAGYQVCAACQGTGFDE